MLRWVVVVRWMVLVKRAKSFHPCELWAEVLQSSKFKALFKLTKGRVGEELVFEILRCGRSGS